MMTPSRSKLTTGAAWLWCGGEGAIHDAIHHAALHIDHIRIAGGILTKRADLDWLKAELDALPALVRSSAQREDATGAQVAKQVMAHQRGRGWTSVDVAADDRAVHVVAVGNQRRDQAGVAAMLRQHALGALKCRPAVVLATGTGGLQVNLLP